jgi:hypothetical protein
VIGSAELIFDATQATADSFPIDELLRPFDEGK